MAFDFPNAPAVGALFAPVGGPTWRWSGTAWLQTAPAGLVPEAPTDGQNYIRQNGLWVVAPNTAQARNRIVNPAMQISQELTKGSTYVAVNSYVADQWLVAFNTTGAPAFAVIADADKDVLWYARLNSTVADAAVGATDYYRIAQLVEGIRVSDFKWGTANAKPALLRFKARSNFLGTFAVSIVTSVSFTKNLTFTATGVWQDFTVAIPGPTSGTFNIDNTSSFLLGFTVMAGSTYIAPSDGVWSSGGFMASPGISNWLSGAGQAFDVANVGLYLDPLATGLPPPFQMPDEAAELQACMRYWQQSYDIWSGAIYSGLAAYGVGVISVPMRGGAPAASGVNVTNTGFPATVGSLTILGPSGAVVREGRTANAGAVTSVVTGQFHTLLTLNARM